MEKTRLIDAVTADRKLLGFLRLFRFSSTKQTSHPTVADTKDLPLSRFTVIATNLIQNVVCIVTHIAIFPFCKVTVEGTDNLKELPDQIILASNHRSDLDSILIRNALGYFSRHGPLIAVARQRKDYVWHGWRWLLYQNWLFNILGAYPAFKGMHDYKKSLRRIVAIARGGSSILIFPGGKKRALNESIKPRGGVGYLAWATEAPVVSVVVVDEGAKGRDNTKVFNRRHIIVRFSKPFTKKELIDHPEPNVTHFKAAATKITKVIEGMLIS